MISTPVSSAPSQEKFNQPMPIPQQPPVIPPIATSLPPTCVAPVAPTLAAPKETAPVILPSVFDPVLESPPQVAMPPSTNNIQKFMPDKPPAPVITSSNMHSIDGELILLISRSNWSAEVVEIRVEKLVWYLMKFYSMCWKC